MPTAKNRHSPLGLQKRYSYVSMLYINSVLGFYSAQNTNVHPKGTCLREKTIQNINFQKHEDVLKVSRMIQIKLGDEDFVLLCFVFIVLLSLTSQFYT